MSSSPDQRAAQMREAIANAERALERSQNFYEEHGLDSEKAKAFFESQMDDKTRAEAQQAFEQDMRDIEQEAHEQAAREASANSTPGVPPRHIRPMV